MGLVFGNIFNKSDNLYDYLDGNSLTAVAKRIETTTNQMLTENEDWFDKLCDFAYRMGLKYKDIPGYHPEVYQFEDFIEPLDEIQELSTNSGISRKIFLSSHPETKMNYTGYEIDVRMVKEEDWGNY